MHYCTLGIPMMGIDTGTNFAIYSLTHTPFVGMGIVSMGRGMGNTAGTPVNTHANAYSLVTYCHLLRMANYQGNDCISSIND
jgi:hypothetical protein